MIASVDGFDRPGLLDLAERLHPGASERAVFAHWLKRSPLRPSRFLPMLDMAVKHAYLIPQPGRTISPPVRRLLNAFWRY